MSAILTRPTPARQDAPFPGAAAARSATRRIMSVTFADGREMVSAQCPQGEAYSVPYLKPLSDARTKLGDVFNILLG